MKMFIDEKRGSHVVIDDGKESGLPTYVGAVKWLEDQAALYEIDQLFKLLADNRGNENYQLACKDLFGFMREKYGRYEWPRLLDDYFNSPAAGRLLAKLQIDSITG